MAYVVNSIEDVKAWDGKEPWVLHAEVIEEDDAPPFVDPDEHARLEILQDAMTERWRELVADGSVSNS